MPSGGSVRSTYSVQKYPRSASGSPIVDISQSGPAVMRGVVAPADRPDSVEDPDAVGVTDAVEQTDAPDKPRTFASSRTDKLPVKMLSDRILVNLESDGERRSTGGILIPAYTAAKSGVAGLTRALANEWAARGVNVNAIAPGYMATDNTAPLRADPVRNEAILARIPAGDWGEANDLQGAVVYLASEASRYVHGSLLVVDGGWLAR